MIRNTLILLFVLSINAFSGEKIFGPEEAMKFEKVRRYDVTDTGEWLYYVLAPDRGDGRLIIRSVEGEKEFEFERGNLATYSDDGKQFAINQKPKELDVLNAKKDKPQDNVILFNTISEERTVLNDVEQFELSNDGKWIAYKNKRVKNKRGDKWKGNDLILRHIRSGSEILIKNSNIYFIDSTSSYLFYTSHSEEGDRNGIYYRDLKSEFAPENVIATDSSKYFVEMSWNKDRSLMAFMKAIPDSNNNADSISILLWDKNIGQTEEITPSFPFENYYIPEFGGLRWTDDGGRLFYEVKAIDEKVEEDEEDKDKKVTEEEFFDFDKILEKTKLYTWHWNDPKILTNQQVEWSREKRRSYMSVYHLDARKNVQLASKELPDVNYGEQNNYLLGMDPNPYMKRRTWDGWYYDLYFVDILSGQKTLIDKELYSTSTLSPDGLNVVYFKDRKWWSYNITTETEFQIAENLNVAWHNELNDRPREPNPYGFGGWIENSQGFVIYDKYDIWLANTGSNGLFSITQAYGRQKKTQFRIKDLTPDEEYIKVGETLFLESFSEKNKHQELVMFGGEGTVKILPHDTLYYSFVKKPKYSDKIIYRRQSYENYPDFYYTDTNFVVTNQITDIHPEISDYNWGTTHMIDYKDPMGEELQGYYILPDNYDPNKKYPLFVYFYERFSDRRHLFSNPTINHRPIYPWYVGQGYIMFFPDIKFYEGYPGKSGLDAVVAGCQALIDKGLVDSSKIALHGHSWSGYQSAFFVTQTDFFAACVSGAPVSNMTSAYSGIRLGSGLARQFQYEKTQSRIGGTMVDSLDSYIRNSPVFFADKMNTPLLIMFGDIDDAVPWQQGVEMYLACRRFDKPCIFLQYENEPHHLRKFENQLDYTFKMKEFFDHYVLGKEAKDWIKNGVPYKGTYNNGNK